jgi:hypothetical protein
MDYRLISKSEVIRSLGKDKTIRACILEESPYFKEVVIKLDHLNIKSVANLLAEKNVVFFEKKGG